MHFSLQNLFHRLETKEIKLNAAFLFKYVVLLLPAETITLVLQTFFGHVPLLIQKETLNQ